MTKPDMNLGEILEDAKRPRRITKTKLRQLIAQHEEDSNFHARQAQMFRRKLAAME